MNSSKVLSLSAAAAASALHALCPVACYSLKPAFVWSPQRFSSIWLVTEKLE